MAKLLRRDDDPGGPGVVVEAVGVDGVVRLRGVVRTTEDKQSAAAITRRVDGVTDVDVTRVNTQDTWSQPNTRQ